MSRPLEILYEDDALVFVNKPARTMSVPAPDDRASDKGAPLPDRLLEQGFKVWPIHRLDYETSGVIVFGKTEQAANDAHEAFRGRLVKKTYIALVQGWPRPRKGQIDMPIQDFGAKAVISKQGRAALTLYEVLDEQGPCSLVACDIPTGRHNQIRLHFAKIGFPLVGERKYALGRDAILTHKRALLHASELTIVSPATGEEVLVRAPLPADFKSVLEKARKMSSKVRHELDRGRSRPLAQGAKSRVRRARPGKGQRRHD